MLRKIKNAINPTYLSALMLFNPSFYSEKGQKEPFFQKELEKIVQKYIPNSQSASKTINFEEAQKNAKEQTYNTLIQKVLKHNTNAGLDSVTKFVPQDYLRKYIEQNYGNLTLAKGEVPLNRLKTLAKTGEEIEYERFKSNGRSSLRKFSENIGYKLGETGKEEDMQRFLTLYKEDIINTANKYTNLEPALLASIALHESKGIPAFSKTGALGLFGLTKYVYAPKGPWFDGTIKEPINPKHTLQAMDRAADYLNGLITLYKRYDDANHTLALAAYNQGETEINKAIKIARANGIKNPKDILNYAEIQYAESVENLASQLTPEFNNTETKKYIISEQGRKYPQLVQNEAKKVKTYFQN